MKLTVSPDPRFWLQLPARFPAGDLADAAAWEAAVAARFAESPLPVAERATALEVARQGRAALAPESTFGVQFWPFPAPAALLVQVEAHAPLAADVDPVSALFGDIPLARVPSIEQFTVPGIGSGIVARFIAAVPQGREPGEAAPAGIGILVSGEHCAVRLLSDPATTTLIGLLDEPLRSLALTMKVEDDD